MLTLKLYKAGTLTNEASFATQEELDAFVAKHREQENFLLSDKAEVSLGLDGEEVITVKPATHTFTITDVTSELELAAAQAAKIEAGKKAREVCQAVLDFISGSNLAKELTIAQITQMQSIYKNAEAALRAGRPGYAVQFISAIEPDGVMVTADEKAYCLSLLAGY